jgi:ribonuclease P protein component
MIKKIYRLKEREVKKVLNRWKPFFSYWIVLNQIKNKFEYNRFAIVIWSKSVNTNVSRNFYRRNFYDIMQEYIEAENKESWFDYVFVVKKQTKLNMKNEENLYNYNKDINFLINKTKNKWKKY